MTMAQHAHLFLHRDARPTPVLDAPWPGRPVGGDPHTVTSSAYASEDGRLLMGVWESTPGTWAVDYRDWEYCHFLQGRCVITREGGDPVEVRGGDVFIVEPGFVGTWDVLETVRKYYVFHLGEPDPTTHPVGAGPHA